MRISINTTIESSCKRIVKRLDKFVGQSLSEEKLQSILYWPRLIKKFATLTFDIDILYLAHLILERFAGGWLIKTRLTTSNRHVLRILNSLPWPPDTIVQISPLRFIDTVLHPGVSTKEDIQALLGEPNGYGGAVLPMGHIPYDVWFYNLIEVSAQASGGAGRIDMQIEVLLIFFEKEVYDGHMWFKDFTTGMFH